MNNDLDLLKRLCEVPGVCGFEDSAQEIVTSELKSCCDEVWSDRMGNVFCCLPAFLAPPDLPILPKPDSAPNRRSAIMPNTVA